jgi:hypothetical protein
MAMDRLRRQPLALTLAFVALSAGLLSASGCTLMATAMYVIQGANTAADFDGLRGKRVAVVCRPVTSLHFRDSSVSRDLAKQVGTLLVKNVPKIELVDQREVFEWADENNWEEYVDIGKAVKADMVVGLDLEEFNLYQGQTLYQGKANLPQAVYPPNAAIPAGEKPETQFRRQFVTYLARQVAHYFFDHDPTVEFASDSTALLD